MNIRLMKAVDSWFGRLLASLLPSAASTDPAADLQSILLIRPGGIGDAVLMAPVINHLRYQYPAIRITVLAERRNAGVFALIPAVDQLCCYDRPAGFMKVLRCSYDLVIDTEQWHRLSAIVARYVRAPVKIGFRTNERCRMFTHTVSYSHDDYEADSFMRLLELVNGSIHCPVNYDAPFLAIPEDTVEIVANLLESVSGKKFVVIFPGASVAERRWEVERFRAVADTLKSQGYGIVVVGGKEDIHAGQQIVDRTGINLAGKTSLAETAAITARSELLISGDSGVLHIAVGLGVSTVSLFGPGRHLKWAPRGDNHRVITKNLPCSPCTTFGTTPPCSYNARCMKEISVADVVEAAISLLQRKAGATD